MSPSLVLGIVAHVDAGKTSLTERLLVEAGVLATAGSVDAGTTRTDSMALERRRGITIRAAVTSFAVGDLEVTVVDTPGHPDFIAEVERSLTVLDAAVLVVSAVEGVQPQTVVIWRALRRIGVPALLFVNKVDRAGADVQRVLGQVHARLTPGAVPVSRVTAAGTATASSDLLPWDAEDLLVAVAEHDDAVLARWVQDDPGLGGDDVRGAVRRGLRDGTLTPVLAGSAVTGAGVADLRSVLADLLTGTAEDPDDATPCAATVFAVDRDARGRRAWLRMWDGTLAVRDRVALSGRESETVTEVAVSRPCGLVREPGVPRGRVAVVRGLSARVGDTVGAPPERRRHRFTPATLQSRVRPVDPSRRPALHDGLAELAEEDPLIDLHLSGEEGELVLTLHGEVQREVLAALLEERYGVAAVFSPTSVACIERVVGQGSAIERLGLAGNPYLATVGLRVEPARTGHGIRFSPGIEPGRLLPAFVTATEEGVRAALRHGLHGWPVTDCLVTMTASLYHPRQSRPHQGFDKSMSTVAADFRSLSQVVVMAALARAGTVVHEPVDGIELEVPDASVGRVVSLLGRRGGVAASTTSAGGYTRLEGTLPTRRVPWLTRALPDLTGGEGALTSRPAHHAPVAGRPPQRPRPRPDPTDRSGWFRDVPR